MTDIDLEAIEAERARLAAAYLTTDRRATPVARGCERVRADGWQDGRGRPLTPS